MKRSSLYLKLYKYAFWVAVLLTIVLSIFLYVFGGYSAWNEQIYAIASSLIASVVFSVMFYFLANKEFIELIRNELESRSGNISDVLLGEVKRFKIAYFPVAEYQPTAGYDPIFNADITADINNTSIYLFRGVTAKYVAARIKYSKQNLSLLKVMLMDPQDASSLNLSASDRAKIPRYQGKSHQELISQLQEEIYSSIIALFDCRNICQVEIAYTQETSVTRIEVFDHALYLACYHTDRASSLTFPDTLKYEKGSFFYQVHRLEFFRQFEVLTKKVTFRSLDSDEQLINHLCQMGMSTVGHEYLTQIRINYSHFQDEFVQSIGMIRR